VRVELAGNMFEEPIDVAPDPRATSLRRTMLLRMRSQGAISTNIRPSIARSIGSMTR